MANFNLPRLRSEPYPIIIFSYLVIFITAAWLRLSYLSVPSLWQDEAHSWWIARLDWGNFFGALRSIGVHPPLYFFLLKGVIALFGESEFALRILSTFADLATLIFGFVLGYLVAGWIGSIIAGWFIAFQPMSVWYSGEARPYALALFFAGLALLLFICLKRKPNSAIYWVLAIFAISLGLLTHFFFFLVWASLILLVLPDLKSNPHFFRRWMVVIIIAFLPTLIWLIWYFQQPAPSLGIGWIGQPKFADIVATGWNLLSGYAGKFSLISVIFGIVATIFVLFGIIHGFTQIKNKRYSSLLILVGLVLSIFTVWVISQRRPIYMDRYFIVMIPGIAYLVATGASYLFNRLSVSPLPVPRLFLMLFSGILILLIGLWQAWQVRVDVKYLREDWRSLSLALKNDSAETPIIWFSDPEAEVPFRYYFGTSYHLIQQIEPPVCKSVCWWILRQPYTSTHAFAQGIHDPDHRWLPEIPSGCAIQDIWESPSGLESWKVKCST